MSNVHVSGPVVPSGPAAAAATPKKKESKRSYVVLLKDGSKWEELKQTFAASSAEKAIEQAADYLSVTSEDPLDEVLVAVAAKYFKPKPVKQEVVTSLKIG